MREFARNLGGSEDPPDGNLRDLEGFFARLASAYVQNDDSEPGRFFETVVTRFERVRQDPKAVSVMVEINRDFTWVLLGAGRVATNLKIGGMHTRHHLFLSLGSRRCVPKRPRKIHIQLLSQTTAYLS